MRLLNALLENEDFAVDEASIPFIVRDIINMNYWNTCDYLLGYRDNKRVFLEYPTKRMKLIGLILKEFYRYDQEQHRDSKAFEKELLGGTTPNSSLRMVKPRGLTAPPEQPMRGSM